MVERKEIPEQYKWNLTDIFATFEDWKNTIEKFSSELGSFEQFRGKLENIGNLKSCLELKDKLNKEIDLIFLYARLQADEDVRISENQALVSSSIQANTEFATAISFIEPELIEIGDKILEFTNEKDLQIYKHYFHDILRNQKHALSAEKEALFATLSELNSSFSNIHNMTNNADIVFQDVVDGEGNKHKLTHGTLAKYLESTDRILRKNAFENSIREYAIRKKGLVQNFIEYLKQERIHAKVKNYNSSLEAKLDKDNIPVEIYSNLIDVINENLKPLHKLYEMRKQKLGLEEFYNYDTNVPLIDGIDTKVTYEEASKNVSEALKFLGEEYHQIVEEGFNNRWVDVYENTGKYSGAYNFSVQGVHPYILMNWSDTINNMFTLAHEFGHALHSHFSHEFQPNITSHYTTFLAEIASTLNEILLHEYLMKNTDDPKKRVYLLSKRIEAFRSTLFRQKTFAEFEKKAHELAQDGKASLDSLNNVYLDVLKKETGSSVLYADGAELGWLRIPHFYMTFYVYQYATSFCASIAIYEMIKSEGQTAIDRYLNMLKAGKSGYSVDLLKTCGVDLTTKEPIEKAMQNFAELVDQLEKELAKI
ncbi:MAG: oligoendopeptidase F [Defluviitaleaceae bacterium]|nr:oligoendopeptidase F [Defluviitaleaceae bacterium]